jgi:hypothetical protein
MSQGKGVKQEEMNVKNKFPISNMGKPLLDVIQHGTSGNSKLFDLVHRVSQGPVYFSSENTTGT